MGFLGRASAQASLSETIRSGGQKTRDPSLQFLRRKDTSSHDSKITKEQDSASRCDKIARKSANRNGDDFRLASLGQTLRFSEELTSHQNPESVHHPPAEEDLRSQQEVQKRVQDDDGEWWSDSLEDFF